MKKLSSDQFEAATYIFEKANGNKHSEFENKWIENSGIAEKTAEELEKIIVEGLNSGIYETWELRTSAYWSLGKIGNKELTKCFKKWLEFEWKNGNEIPVFQILIGLDRLGEQSFKKGRTAFYVTEAKEYMKDAEIYLKNNAQQNV